MVHCPTYYIINVVSKVIVFELPKSEVSEVIRLKDSALLTSVSASRASRS